MTFHVLFFHVPLSRREASKSLIKKFISSLTFSTCHRLLRSTQFFFHMKPPLKIRFLLFSLAVSWWKAKKQHTHNLVRIERVASADSVWWRCAHTRNYFEGVYCVRQEKRKSRAAHDCEHMTWQLNSFLPSIITIIVIFFCCQKSLHNENLFTLFIFFYFFHAIHYNSVWFFLIIWCFIQFYYYLLSWRQKIMKGLFGYFKVFIHKSHTIHWDSYW